MPPRHQIAYSPDVVVSRALNVYVGLSGGVDSSVAAAVLKEQGHQVTGVFMRNWDTADEQGMETCPADADLESAKAVAEHIGIPLVERGFEPEYWASVFEPFVSAYAEGRTPNPDIACNRHVKFGAFFQWCRAQGAEAVATGHYATLLGGLAAAGTGTSTAQAAAEAAAYHHGDSIDHTHSPVWRLPDRERAGTETASLRAGGRPVALCPVTFSQDACALAHATDAFKDQSYFLCGVSRDTLEHVLLPLGSWPKTRVRAEARARALPSAGRRDSTGICFIGKRPMRQFLPQYLRPTPGEFVMAETGAVVGRHEGAEVFTVGQSARVSGAASRLFTLSRDVRSGRVWVVDRWDHAALFAPSLTLAGDPALPGGLPVELSALRSVDGVGWRLPSGRAPAAHAASVGAPDPDSAATPLLRAAAHARLCTGLSSSKPWDRPPFNWLVGDDWSGFAHLAAGSGVRVLAKLNNRMPPASGTLWLVRGGRQVDGSNAGLLQLAVELDLPHRAVSPGQVAALYVPAEMTNGLAPLVCVGGGEIGLPGPSLAELGLAAVSPSQEQLGKRGRDGRVVAMPQLGSTPDAVDCGVADPEWSIDGTCSTGWTA